MDFVTPGVHFDRADLDSRLDSQLFRSNELSLLNFLGISNSSLENKTETRQIKEEKIIYLPQLDENGLILCQSFFYAFRTYGLENRIMRIF